MSNTCLPTAKLDPAYSLVYQGLAADAAMDKLRAPLSKMLKVDPGALSSLLDQDSLLLGTSPQREKLLSQSEQLKSWGCATQLEPVWRYRHWTLSQGLVELLKMLASMPTAKCLPCSTSNRRRVFHACIKSAAS